MHVRFPKPSKIGHSGEEFANRGDMRIRIAKYNDSGPPSTNWGRGQFGELSAFEEILGSLGAVIKAAAATMSFVRGERPAP